MKIKNPKSLCIFRFKWLFGFKSTKMTILTSASLFLYCSDPRVLWCALSIDKHITFIMNYYYDLLLPFVEQLFFFLPQLMVNVLWGIWESLSFSLKASSLILCCFYSCLDPVSTTGIISVFIIVHQCLFDALYTHKHTHTHKYCVQLIN